MFVSYYQSPLGWIRLTAQQGALTGLSFVPGTEDALQGQEGPEAPLLAQGRRWLDAYFAGHPLRMQIPLAPAGTAFQKQVWQLLLEVPYGEVCTYGQLARQVASYLGRQQMSAQAVGQAVGKNPIWLMIPCHRCIGQGGKLTGYAGGLERKRWLLAHEQGKPLPPLP